MTFDGRKKKPYNLTPKTHENPTTTEPPLDVGPEVTAHAHAHAEHAILTVPSSNSALHSRGADRRPQNQPRPHPAGRSRPALGRQGAQASSGELSLPLSSWRAWLSSRGREGGRRRPRGRGARLVGVGVGVRSRSKVRVRVRVRVRVGVRSRVGVGVRIKVLEEAVWRRFCLRVCGGDNEASQRSAKRS